MQKSTDPNTSLPLDSLKVLNILLGSTNFREKIPAALQGFTRLAEADSTLLLELMPNRLNELEFEYQRVIEVSYAGQVTEHQVPSAVAGRRFEFAPLIMWLIHFGRGNVEKSEPPKKIPAVVSAHNQQAIAYERLRDEKFSWAIYSSVELECKAFILLPLIHQNQLWGFVFTSSHVERQWAKGVLELGKTFGRLLGRLLHEDYYEQRKLIGKNRQNEHSFNHYPAREYDSSLVDKASLLSQLDFVRALATTVPDYLFVVDLEKNELVYCSKDQLLGYDLAAEKNPLAFFASILHPDQRATGIHNFFQRFREAKDDEVVESEYCIRHRNGQWVWVQERMRVFQRFPDGKVKQYLSAMVDITERKLNAIQLKKSQKRYQNFIKYSAEGIYFMNCGTPIPVDLPAEEQTRMYYDHAYIEECNEAMVEMYGIDKQSDMIGRRIEDIHQGKNYEQNRLSFRIFVENGYKIENFETQEQDVNGEWHYFINQAIGVVEEERLVGIWGVQRDATEARKAEQALRESELRLSAFVEDAQLGIWDWNWEQDRITVNNTLLEILALPTNKRVFSGGEFLALTAEPYRDILTQATQYHLENETENYQVELKMGPNAEKMRWVHLHGRLVEKNTDNSPKRLIGNVINIHENKVAKLLIKKGEDLLEAVVHAIPDTKFRVASNGEILAVYTVDKEHTYPAFRQQKVVGKKLEEIFPLPIAKGLEFNAAKALQAKTLQTFEFVDDDQQEEKRRYYEARINAINDDELILILRDVSAIKTTEQALTEQIHEVDRKNRELEAYIKSNLQLENFAYIASHDLREPVRTMRTFSQFLKKRAGDQLDKDSKMYLDFIISGANRMNQLIQDLLTYSRVNTEPFENEIIKVTELLDRVQENLQSRIEEEGAKISFDSLPDNIQGSSIRLEQLFQNLLSNAIKFHQEGVPPEVLVTATETNTHWQFTVADNGIGIDPEFHEQVFVIFKKLHNNQAYQGTGIGLALVKRIVTQHKGEVWLESALGEGTRIHFTLRKFR